MIYLLDTDIASDIIKGDRPGVRERLAVTPMQDAAVSVITQAELLYGVAKRGSPKGLDTRVREFLVRVAILPWNAEVGQAYGVLRASWEAAGIVLAPLDMMIAAHAKALDATLVTRHRVFSLISEKLHLVDWAIYR